MKKLLRIIIAFVFVSTIVTLSVIAADFYDLPRDNSEKSQAVYKLADAGIVGGYENGTFRPDNQLTRAELCKIVNLIFDFSTPHTINFADIKNTDWFYGHVLIAKQAGYINGFEDNTFRGNNKLTREQTCAIISRIVKLELASSDITINDNVSAWAESDVLKVISNGIMPLEENGNFRATENITRAELCMALARYVKAVNPEPSQKVYSAEELNEQAKKYVGEITCFDKSGNAISIGTGFVYTEDGKVITNYHVIDGGYSAKIIINGVEYEIKSILGYDENIDLAILKIDGVNLAHATICEKDSATGNTIYAIGSSRGLTNTFSKGIITYYNRVLDNVSYIQHDASITNGNSGGPLINEYGEVIGVNTWGVNDSQNLNFAVSISELKNIKLDKSLTLSQLFDISFNAYDVLADWVQKNYTHVESDRIACSMKKSEREFFALVYYPEDSLFFISYTIGYDNGDAMVVFLPIDDSQDAYYSAEYYGKDESNTLTGYINKKQFTADTALTYTKSEGADWRINSLLETYQEGLVVLLGFFDEFLKSYNFNLTLKDFGYDSFVPQKWEPYQSKVEAFKKVINYMVKNGEYVKEMACYYFRLKQEYQQDNYLSFSAFYYPTDNKLSLTLTYYLNDPMYKTDYFVSITMKDFNGVYDWYYIDSSERKMGGVLYANTFNSNTLLYYNYDNVYSLQSEKEVQKNVSILINNIAIYLDTFFAEIGITAEDMGFYNY